eukprot:TRINITY_DN6129_c0_g1_i1.p1 TRINITY_DN6129_c0_g1~~TRINITY_DN6129_c0_g1_i1.p1  ORF type:complete len:195 (+),score=62.42 TRINITY_DN6129_c0_g1_i1:30-614(+)
MTEDPEGSSFVKYLRRNGVNTSMVPLGVWFDTRQYGWGAMNADKAWRRVKANAPLFFVNYALATLLIAVLYTLMYHVLAWALAIDVIYVCIVLYVRLPQALHPSAIIAGFVACNLLPSLLLGALPLWLSMWAFDLVVISAFALFYDSTGLPAALKISSAVKAVDKTLDNASAKVNRFAAKVDDFAKELTHTKKN